MNICIYLYIQERRYFLDSIYTYYILFNYGQDDQSKHTFCADSKLLIIDKPAGIFTRTAFFKYKQSIGMDKYINKIISQSSL